MYVGIALIFIGILYIVKPDIFKRWFWTKTSLAQRFFKPDQYLIYMRSIGIISILLGLAAIVFDYK
ncbi:hypothetical protein B1H38_16670 [Leptospira borgpetersenii serovar Ballum]|nr:hypothetical protein IQ66_19285 [Leptospira borgpetersenii serovar Ballum]OOV41839.1 hypothetical protein B1H38_16670 [Leptospira borgpetersenii serovar Ballum]